jgi:hypothetical protein
VNQCPNNIASAGLQCNAAGAPKTNTTFFCEALSGNCFLLRTTGLGFYDAADTCAAFVGGNLVTYTSRSKQMLVENYFGSLLPTTHYWHGASRAALGSDYTLTDGMPIMQVSWIANFVAAETRICWPC